MDRDRGWETVALTGAPIEHVPGEHSRIRQVTPRERAEPPACRVVERMLTRRDRHGPGSAWSSARNRAIAASTSRPRASISSRSSVGVRVSPAAFAVGFTAFRS